jgi:putative cardiolipin synthase
MSAPRILYGLLGCATIAAALAAGCNSLPVNTERVPSAAITNTGATRLGIAVNELTAAHPGRSGYYPLPDGRDAFAARALLARAAQRSLDIQYYIWRNDTTGNLMFDAVRAAADRGVRVRLLLDDNNTAGLDEVLLALDAHPNIEVRLFNPFAVRSPRALGYLTDFSRLNRRMHNKAFIADNQVGIVGGRNMGDEYFGAGNDMLFIDLDVMGIGPVVQALSRDFDRYWNSRSAFPVSAIVPHMGGRPPLVPARLALSTEAHSYVDAVRRSPFVEQLVRRQLPMEWATTRLVSDDPDKVLGRARAPELVASQLGALFGTPRRELNLVSPYFVPGRMAADMFESMAKGGIRVTILTNALEATDVVAVHAGYVKWREELLRSGVLLYELKRFGAVEARPRRGSAMGSSSASSLHAKTFSVDSDRVFVGSFNLDQRSVSLNTELGLVVESPGLAGRLSSALHDKMPELAYEVRLGPDGNLFWVERSGGKLIRHDTEPGANRWERGMIRLLSLMPIDWLL